MINLLAIPFIALGGAISRWCGGGIIPAIHRPVPQMFYALPFAIVAWHVSSIENLYINLSVILSVYVLTTLVKTTGLGEWLDMGDMPYIDRNNKLAPVVDCIWFKVFHRSDVVYHDNGQKTYIDSRDNAFWYDFIGMAVTGLVVTLPLGLLLMTQNHHLIGIVFALTGASKAVAYSVGEIWDRTDIREVLTGMFNYGALCGVWWLV